MFGKRDYLFPEHSWRDRVPWKFLVAIGRAEKQKVIYGVQVCCLLKHEPCCDDSVMTWAKKRRLGKDDRNWEGNRVEQHGLSLHGRPNMRISQESMRCHGEIMMKATSQCLTQVGGLLDQRALVGRKCMEMTPDD